MKKLFPLFILAFLSFSLFAQESLKSIEEQYYDFLSLTGTVKKPSLGYRTLSDSYWEFEENNDFQKESDTLLPEEKSAENDTDNSIKDNSIINPWKDINLGKKRSIKENDKLFFKIYAPEIYYSINSETPFGQNDGALWQGKGYNMNLTTGARLEAYGLELTFRPEFSFSQNKDFDTIGDVDNYSWCNSKSFINTDSYGLLYESVYGQGTSIPNNAGGNVDLVQRYGSSAVKKFDWGDSEIRYTYKKFTFGFGTQKPWLGPALLNPMLGSNNSASYPKFDIGMRRAKIIIPKLKWYIGDFEGRIWTGLLKESDYFDDDSDNDNRMLNGLSLSFAPSFIPGFSMGVNRIFLSNWKISNLKYLARLFTSSNENGTNSGNDEDQKIAFYADWSFPKVGLEVYGELGIDDFTSNKETNPFHTAIYTVGAKQYIPLPLYKLFPNAWKNVNLHSQLSIEWNNFEMSQDFQMQWPYLGYYSHGAVKQGYTNDGQILGAGSGSFGNSQYIEYKVYYPKGSTSLHFHRYSPNNNIILSQAVKTSASNSIISDAYYANYETYYDFGLRTNYFITKGLNVNLGFDWVEIYNWRYNQGREKRNLQLSFGAKYNFF